MPTVLPTPRNPVLAEAERRFRRGKSLIQVRHSGLVESAGTTVTASRETSSTSIAIPLPVSQGGTGGTSASAARTNLLPSKTGNANKVLAVKADESDFELVSAGSGSGLTHPEVMARAWVI